MDNPFFYALLMFLAGIGIPIMAALNGGLGVKLQNPVLAVIILFSVGLIASLIVLLFTQGLSVPNFEKVSPWYLYSGGIFVIFYVLSITWVGPRFGIANAVSFVLLGQLLAMTLIDHFGAMGSIQYSVTAQRAFGLLLMAAGVLMVVNRVPSLE